jgi:hypothetical protein
MEDIEKSPDPQEAPDTPSHEGQTLEFNEKHADIGLGLFQQSHQYDTAQLELDAVKVRRKLDFLLLPMVC